MLIFVIIIMVIDTATNYKIIMERLNVSHKRTWTILAPPQLQREYLQTNSGF